ncbi:MAG: hypothetical protein ACPKNR_06025 [Pleomorphochaeta sp.]
MKIKKKMIALVLLGLSLIFISCANEEFKISSIESNIDYISTYKINENNEFDLIEEYPNLSLGVDFTQSDLTIAKMELYNSLKTLKWEFIPEKIMINNHQVLGSANINLASKEFASSMYSIKILNNDGRELEKSFNLNNSITPQDLFIYLKNDVLYFSNLAIDNFSNVKELEKTSQNQNIINANYYNQNKELISSDNLINQISTKTYPFKISIDKLSDIKYVKLICNNNIIYIDLSPSNGLL